LHLTAEVTVVGIFADKEGLSLISEELKNTISADGKSHTRFCGD
jgi:regulator of nonsense transcripts 2